MGDPNDTPSWASGPAIDEEDDAPAWAGGPAIEEASAPRQGGDEDSPLGKPLRSMEAKQGDVMPELSAQTRVTELAPFDVQGDTRGVDTMPTRTARTPQTTLPETQVQGETSALRGDRVMVDLPPAVREGIDTVRRLRHERESGGAGVTPLDLVVRPTTEDEQPAPAPEAVDFSPRAFGAQASAAVPFAEMIAAAARSRAGGRSYGEERASIRSELDAMDREHPTESRLGRNASMAAQMLAVPNLSGMAGEALATRGYGAGAQALGTIAAGSAEGALYGTGLSHEDSLGGIAHDAANGALMGALPGVVGGTARDVTAVRRELARGTGAAAIGQRVAAAGPTAAQLRRANDRIGLPALAADMERLGMTGTTMTAPQIAARADEVVAQAGPEMGRILREASASTPGYREGAPLGLDRSAIAARIHRDVVAPLEGRAGVEARQAARRVNSWLDDFHADPDALTPEAAHRAQVELADLAGYNANGPNLAQDAYRDIRRVMGEAVDESLEQAGQRIGDPELARRYADARRSYATAATVRDFTGPSRDTANRVVSLTDTIAATGGALAGGPAGALTGVAAAAANRWLRRREHSLAASGLERLTEALQQPGMVERIPPAVRNTLANAARRGPGVYAATVFSALHTGTPEEREAIQAAMEGGTETAP